MEVWGGNRQLTREVGMPGLAAWIYAKPSGSPEGGDVHYFSVCGEEVLSRVVLADVSGHGAEVSAAAQTLHSLMRESINTWDQSEFVRRVNASFRGLASGGHYATAIVAGFCRDTGELLFTNAGHPPPLLYRHRANAWTWLEDNQVPGTRTAMEDLPVGLIEGTAYRQCVTTLEPSDMLVLYSDGVSEAENQLGEMLTRDRLKEWVMTGPCDNAASTGLFLADRLRRFRTEFAADDETIIVIKLEAFHER
jgi:serine phosphatase RsbU (regulator of sigma subunit)